MRIQATEAGVFSWVVRLVGRKARGDRQGTD